VEVARPWILLAGYLVTAAFGLWWVAVPLSFCVMLAAFVQLHDTIHGSLGLSKKANNFLLTASGLLLLKSGKANQVTHLRHHGMNLGKNDPEGQPANWKFWKVIFHGPYHVLSMRWESMKIAPRTRKRQLWETGLTVLILVVILLSYFVFDSWIGMVFWGAAFVMSSTMPIWATYIPHHLAPANPLRLVSMRLVRFWTPVITSFAFHHLHHDHPKVPTALLPEVAKGELGGEQIHAK
jgi:fatty acid desaturase